MYKYILLLVSVILTTSCGNGDTAREVSDISHSGDTIIIKENSHLLKHLVVRQSELQDYSPEFQTVGIVRPAEGRLAELAVPFAGRIVKSHVQLGQQVNVGSPVFEVGSPEFYETAKAYFAAQADHELAQKNYERQKELSTHGVGAQKDMEQARSEASIARREVEQAKAILQIYNTDVAKLQMGQPLKVVSPIKGEVIKSNITIGSYAKEDSEPLVVVADLSHVWVAALVREKYLGVIKPGDQVEIHTPANPEKIIRGAIHYIGEILDEETRSLEVIVGCDNRQRELKLGMFCEVHFLSSPSRAIIIPSAAVMQEQDSDYVLVEVTERKFVRRLVETASAGNGTVCVGNGLAEGERVVVEGGIFLNM